MHLFVTLTILLLLRTRQGVRTVLVSRSVPEALPEVENKALEVVFLPFSRQSTRGKDKPDIPTPVDETDTPGQSQFSRYGSHFQQNGLDEAQISANGHSGAPETGDSGDLIPKTPGNRNPRETRRRNAAVKPKALNKRKSQSSGVNRLSSFINRILRHFKDAWKKVQEFFWGNGVSEPSDTSFRSAPEIKYGPQEKEEREEIVKRLKGLTTLGAAPKDWLQGLDLRFKELPAITEVFSEGSMPNETINLLNILVENLSRPELTQRQRTVVLDAINHITKYNTVSKKAVFKAATRYLDVFKALAYAISTRPISSKVVKGSFEADWLSNKSVAERYNRILLVQQQPEHLMPAVKELTQRLEKVDDVTVWNQVDGTPSDLHHTMNQALKLFKHKLGDDNRAYVEEIIQYICSVNTAAYDLLVTHLKDEEYVNLMLTTWVKVQGDDLFETLHEGSVQIKLLSDEHVGAALDRKLLDLVIPSDWVPSKIRKLKEDLIRLDIRTTPNVENLLQRAVFGLRDSKENGRLGMVDDQNYYLKMIAYLERWRSGVKYDLYRYFDINPDLLMIMTDFFANKLENDLNEVHGQSWTSRILKGTRYEELVLRQKLISKEHKVEPYSQSLYESLILRTKKLPTDWWGPLHPEGEVKHIVDDTLIFLNDFSITPPNDPIGMHALEILWHLLRFKPSLREEIYIAVHKESSHYLRRWLRSYLHEHTKISEGNFSLCQLSFQASNDLVHWLSKIEILQKDQFKVDVWTKTASRAISTCMETASTAVGIAKNVYEQGHQFVKDRWLRTWGRQRPEAVLPSSAT